MADMILTEEEQMLQNLARDFADKELMPRAKEVDDKEEFSWETWKGMSDLGLTGISIDTKYGGGGGGYRQTAILASEIARGDASASVCLLTHVSLGTSTIQRFGSEEQCQRFIPDLTSGKKVAAWALTEPGGGSDAAALKTTAVERDGTYFLNGSKTFITNGAEADTVVVFATHDTSKGYKGVSAFVVPRNSPGFQVNPLHGKMGMRGSSTCELVFQDTPVPMENRLGEEGMASAMPCRF